MHSDFLFPIRQTRRDFLKLAGATAAATTLPGFTTAEDKKTEPVKFGSGKFTYALDENWGKLPAGMGYGLGCAIVVDSKDRIIVTSRSASPCVAIFDADGKLLETWSRELADNIGYSPQQIVATAHGLYWSKEDDGEYLYWTENVANDKGKKIGARVYKTDMNGKVLYQIGNVDKESSTSAKFELTNPTDVAVAANGDIYVVDGYGNQKVHRFDKNFKLIKTIGGRGKEHGLFNTCHGVWVSTLNKEPELYIADRHNDRIEVYSLELQYKRTVGDVRTPCCFYEHNGFLFVPELGQRVSVLDPADKVVARLGDGAGIKDIGKPEIYSKLPDKFAFPHALTLDSKGNLYVLEWVPTGRPRKLAPATA
ncbi:MAG: twin-arginine translocation signal domain-containing protein [Gemmataceae bacterium]